MQEKGLIKVHLDEDPNLKRFKITDAGREYVKEVLSHGDHLKSRNLNLRKMYWRIHMGMPGELYESLGALLDAVEENYMMHKGNDEASEGLKAALDSAVNEIREIDS
jgi:DNA-binding PadR family transcriptional regulator|tara:strand:+ start:1058 stop:1378 length:321 start_codon:yes stop_codon:yes gene_type:complete